jgi:MoaA/NifB/PqqE/SkfB family radical SAM enzyme
VPLRFKGKLSYILLYSGFSSLLRFVAVNPNTAYIMLTENCNSRCVTCNVWKKSKSVNELTTEEMKDVLHQLKEMGITQLVFTGGEPLLRNDVGAIVKEAKSLRFKDIIVVTNGLLLEKKAEELLDNGVTHIDVSIDAVGEANDRIRGVPGYYERAINGIKAVQRLKKSKDLDVAVTIMTILLMNDNVDHIPELIEVAKSLDTYSLFNLLGDHIDISKGIPFSDLLVRDEGKIDETIDYLKMVKKKHPMLISQCDYTLEYARNYLKGKNRYDFHCVHGYKMVYLGAHGEIYPSCWAMPPIGNVREDKLRDVVGSEKQRELAKKMYKMECPKCIQHYIPNLMVKHLISHKLRCEKAQNK